MTKSDEMVTFSSRGPSLHDATVKPDLTAPGHNIVAARAAGTHLGNNAGEHYSALSGTSMATPHVAGAAAILAQAHPDWTGEQLKAALMGTTRTVAKARVRDQGTGRLDVARAVSQPVYATPASLNFGTLPWPHDNQAPVTKSVTVHNHGQTPLSLNVAISATDPDGKPAPSGLFTSGAKTVTVPAKGTAPVPITFNPAVKSADGRYSAHLTATSRDGRTTVNVALGANKERESFDVTINAIDRDGKPANARRAQVSLQGLDHVHYQRRPLSEDGRLTLRLEKGRYHLGALIQTGALPSPSYTVLGEPDVAVTGNLTITLDARKGNPVTATVDHPDRGRIERSLGTMLFGKHRLPLASGILAHPLQATPTLYAAPSTRTAAKPESFGYEYATRFSDPEVATDPSAITDGDVFNVHMYNAGSIPADVTYHLKDSDFAVVHDQIYRAGPVDTVSHNNFSAIPGKSYFLAFGSRLTTPRKLTSYFTTGPVRWSSGIHYRGADGATNFLADTTDRVFRKPGTITDEWDRGVHSPAFPPAAEPFVARRADTINVRIPLYTDSGRDHFGSQLDSGESATMKLYRDGQLVAERSGYRAEFDVPPGEASYRLVVESGREGPGIELATRNDAVWTFRSGHVPGDRAVALPIMAVRFTAPVDLFNTAPAGRTVVVPVVVQRQADSGKARIERLTVDVSYDDGKTWKAVAVSGSLLRLSHPPLGETNGFVSLRASATDVKGNRVDQTVIRAYKLKPGR